MNLLRNPVGIGKLVGILVGLAGFFMLPVVWPEADLRLRWGLLLWYTTFGAIIGVFGTDPQPAAIVVRLPWWLRSVMLGAWLNFVLSFFAWDVMKSLLLSVMGGEGGVLTSPYWFALEGAIIGLLVGYVATRLGKPPAGSAD